MQIDLVASDTSGRAVAGVYLSIDGSHVRFLGRAGSWNEGEKNARMRGEHTCAESTARLYPGYIGSKACSRT